MSAALCELDARITSTADYAATIRDNKDKKKKEICTSPRHGTLTAYRVDRCRCPAARAANARNQRQRRLEIHRGISRTTPASPYQQQVRALMTLGWRGRDLAPRIGWACGELHTIFQRKWLYPPLAARIAAVYVELRDQPGPSARTRRRAAANGWLTPDDLDYGPATIVGPVIDDVAVQRALDGVPVPLSREERITAVLRGAQRYGVSELTVRLRMSGGRVRQILNQQEKAS